MTPLQIAQLALSIFGTLEPIVQPYAIAGFSALVNVIKSHIASGRKMSFGEVHDIARQHGVNMPAVYVRVALSGLISAYVVGRLIAAARRK